MVVSTLSQFNPFIMKEGAKMKLVGLKGEVFNANGRVAFLIPPRANAEVVFDIQKVWPAMSDPQKGVCPPWADMVITDHGREVYCRISPEICKNLYRLADCVVFASQNAEKLRFAPELAAVSLGGEEFLFWRTMLIGVSVVMIDKKSRVEAWEENGARPSRSGEGQTEKEVTRMRLVEADVVSKSWLVVLEVDGREVPVEYSFYFENRTTAYSTVRRAEVEWVGDTEPEGITKQEVLEFLVDQKLPD